MNQKDLREKLNVITEKGLSSKVIAKSIGINEIDMSRFKNGKICLIEEVANKLEAYLDKVIIP